MDDQKTIYIAGGFKSRTFVRRVMDFAEWVGFELGVDWTADDFVGDNFTHEEAEGFSKRDYEAIESSRFFLLLADTEIGGGALVELGIAYALGKTIYVAGSMNMSQMFYFLPGIRRRREWEDALCQMMIGEWRQDENDSG